MSITVVTVTGGRPICLNLLNQWLQAQTYQNFEWLVVCNYDHFRFIKPTRCNRVEYNQHPDLNHSLDIVLRKLSGTVIFCEDDDYYAPDYIETAINAINIESTLLGVACNKYYNVEFDAAKQLKNTRHSSLASTVIANVESIVLPEPSVELYDIELWQLNRGCKLNIPNNKMLGIKGMPGRVGLAKGHTKDFYTVFDRNDRILKEWLSYNKTASDIYSKY